MRPINALILAIPLLCTSLHGIAAADPLPEDEALHPPLVQKPTQADGLVAPSSEISSSFLTAPPLPARLSLKSPTTALAAPLGVTVGSLAVAGLMMRTPNVDLFLAGYLVGSAGLIVGPSVGHFYTYDLRFIPLLAGRGALSIVSSAALLVALSEAFCEGGAESGCQQDHISEAIGIAGASLVAALALAVIEIALSPGSAERHNKRLGSDSLVIVPTFYAERGKTGHGVVPSLAATMRF